MAIVNALQLEAARCHTSPFLHFTTPCQVWTHWTILK